MLLTYSKGITLETKTTDGFLFNNPLKGLTFLRFMKDISGLDFTDIKINDHEKSVLVTREMLITEKLTGAQNAIISSPTQASTSSLVKQRECWQSKHEATVAAQKEPLTSAFVKLPR